LQPPKYFGGCATVFACRKPEEEEEEEEMSVEHNNHWFRRPSSTPYGEDEDERSTPSHGPHMQETARSALGSSHHVVENAGDDGAGQVPESASGPALVVAAAEMKEEGTEEIVNKQDLKQEEVPS
jgi:hypothetical protein